MVYPKRQYPNLEDDDTVTPRNFNATCEKFNVNPDWLRYGFGEMFLPEKTETYLEKVVAEKNLSIEDGVLMESIFDLSPEARKVIVNWVEQLVDDVHLKTTEQAVEDERRALEKQKVDI